MPDPTLRAIKGLSIPSQNSLLKQGSRRRSYKNGKMVIAENDQSNSEARSRMDTYGNIITREKKHRIRLNDKPQIIEVENWKDLNVLQEKKSTCSICTIM